MSRVLFTLAAMSMLICPPSVANGDDWSVRRSGFDPRMVARYKQLLRRRPNDGYALARLLKLYRKHRSVGALIKEYRRRAKAHPKSFAYQVIVGHLYRRTGNKTQAVIFYERAAKLRPRSPTVPAALGALYHRLGKTAAAVAAFKKALSLARSKRQKKRYLRRLANIALTAGKLAEARKYFKRLVALDPRNIFLRIELAQSLKKAKLYKEALAEYRKIIKRTRDSRMRANVLKAIGAIQHKMGKSKQAIATYRKAMALAARGNWIRRELTDRIISIHREKDDLKGLIAYYVKHWKRKGHFEWQVLARLYDETGDEARAMKAYKAALKRRPRAIDTRVRLIALLERTGRAKEVVGQYRKLARMAPGEPRYQLELAKRLYRAGKRREALAVLERAGKRFPRDASVHSALADLYARWGEQKRAMREAKVLVRIEPRDDSHLINLGEQYFLRGKKRKAVETWRRLLRVIRQKHRAYARLAAILGDHGMTKEALRLFRKAIKRKPKMLPYRRNLALLLERKRRTSKAITAWEAVVKLAQKQKARQTLREARTHIISILHKSRRLYRYIRIYRQRFHATPPDVEAGYFLAEAYRKYNKNKQAAATYRRILKLRPNNIEALLALEAVYRRQRKLDKAVKVLKLLAKLQPAQAAEYYQRIANLLLLLYRDREAMIYAQKVTTAGRPTARSYQRLGELFERKEDFKRAIDAYRKALKINPRLELASFSLARLLTRQGHYDAAEKAYRKLMLKAATPESILRAFRRGIDLSSYLGRLEKLEKALQPLSVLATNNARIYRRLLVKIYRRRVPTLVYKARQGSRATRAKARAALKKIGLRGMAPLLEELANDSTPASTKAELIRVLGYLGNPNAALPLLRIALKEPNELPVTIYAYRSRPHHRRYYHRRYGRRYRRYSRAAQQVARRLAATVAVGRLADSRAIPGLLKLMRSNEGSLRDAATWALTRQRGRKVKKRLFAAFGDQRSNVQMFACAGLGVQGDRKMRPVLEEVMGDTSRHERVRAACAWALGALGDPRAVNALIGVMRSGDDELQRCAAWSIGVLRSRKAVTELVHALWNRRPDVRRAVVWALIRLAKGGAAKRPGTTPDVLVKQSRVDGGDFVRRLSEDVDQLRGSARAAQLGSVVVGHRQAIVTGVKTALKRHRDVVLRVLRDLDGDPARLTLGPLTAGRSLLKRPARAKLDAAVAGLAKEFTPSVRALLGHRDDLVRRRAVAVYVKLGAKDLHAQLKRVLRDRNWAVRTTALRALTKARNRRLASSQARGLAAVGLRSKHWREREAAVELLGAVRGAASLPLLRRALADDNGFVREAAARALGRLRAPKAAAALRKALADDVPHVRAAACSAAARRRARSLRPEIAKLTRDRSPLVRRAAKRALAALR